MRIKIFTVIIFISCYVFTGCQKDNYDPPKSSLQGALLYKGDSIGVSYNDVSFQLWQSGFGKLSPIDVTVDQDGSFSALLFDGDYKLIIPPGQGPFTGVTDSGTHSDTLLVQVKGDRKLNIEVMPYYMIRNARFSVSDAVVQARFSIEKIIDGLDAKDIQSVSLYIGKTRFLDKRTSIGSATLAGGNIADLEAITLSEKIPEMTPAQDYIFVRIGVKINAVEDMIFSSVVELDF